MLVLFLVWLMELVFIDGLMLEFGCWGGLEGAAVGWADSWVMMGRAVCGVILGDITTATAGYATVSHCCSSSSNGTSATIGGRADTHVIGLCGVCGTLGVVPSCCSICSSGGL